MYSESQDEQLLVSLPGWYQLLRVGELELVMLTGTSNPEDESVRWSASLSLLESG